MLAIFCNILSYNPADLLRAATLSAGETQKYRFSFDVSEYKANVLGAFKALDSISPNSLYYTWTFFRENESREASRLILGSPVHTFAKSVLECS